MQKQKKNLLQTIISRITNSDIPEYQKHQRLYEVKSKTFYPYIGSTGNSMKQKFKYVHGVSWRNCHMKKLKRLFSRMYNRGLI